MYFKQHEAQSKSKEESRKFSKIYYNGIGVHGENTSWFSLGHCVIHSKSTRAQPCTKLYNISEAWFPYL